MLEVEADIVSYISSSLAKKIKNEFSSSVATCICKPTQTCTPTGCFISTSCLTLTCKLKDDRVSTDDIQIKFRIVQALNENQIIIGLNEVQEHDLTKVFRHL